MPDTSKESAFFIVSKPNRNRSSGFSVNAGLERARVEVIKNAKVIAIRDVLVFISFSLFYFLVLV